MTTENVVFPYFAYRLIFRRDLYINITVMNKMMVFSVCIWTESGHPQFSFPEPLLCILRRYVGTCIMKGSFKNIHISISQTWSSFTNIGHFGLQLWLWTNKHVDVNTYVYMAIYTLPKLYSLCFECCHCSPTKYIYRCFVGPFPYIVYHPCLTPSPYIITRSPYLKVSWWITSSQSTPKRPTVGLFALQLYNTGCWKARNAKLDICLFIFLLPFNLMLCVGHTSHFLGF